MNQIKRVISLLVFLTIVLAGCSSQETIQFSEVWARPGLVGGNSAVYFVVSNPLDIEEKILSVSSDIAAAVEIHKSSMVDDVMKMEKQDFVLLPGGEDVLFQPGGLHIMLIGLEKDLNFDDTFKVIFILENEGEVVIDVIVKEQ